MGKKAIVDAERCNKNATANPLTVENVDEEHLQYYVSQNMEDFNDSDWEDGSIPILDESQSHPLTIEFSEKQQTPDSTRRKPVRRASAADKEIAELVHKVHLLCLLGRGRLIDRACDDPLIQSALLSLLPTHLLKTSSTKRVTASSLKPLVTWLHQNFRVRKQSGSEGFVNTALARALETHEGTPEEIAALTVALFRALDYTTRFVSILDVASIKPEAENFEYFGQQPRRSRRDIFKTSTLMVDGAKHVDKVSLSSLFHENKDLSKSTSIDYCESDATNLAGKKTEVLNELTCTPSTSCCILQPDISETCPTKNSLEQKRKGDVEFEMQLQMALSATAVEATAKNSDVNYSTEPSPKVPLPKRMKRIISEESASSSHGISTAVGSSKVGSPLYWAEVYCNAENLTGKWVHVDAVNMIVDGEHKVEALAAACKTSLRYVVAFSGLGAKDVTRRYCMKWYKIERNRVDTLWWNRVLAPLRILEGRAIGVSGHLETSCIDSLVEHDKVKTSCVLDNLKQKILLDDGILPEKPELNMSEECHMMTDPVSSLGNEFIATRDYLEDMELETRALTEPLPTNQQAYKSHRLYALEKWLTKYQMLHPRGPVLGYCSGHPVYPRTCVKMLKTREKWLREGLQLKSNELPVKELKHSIKNKVQESETDDCDQGDSKGVIKLYGKWQLEPLQLPQAVNGIVPKNERGQVEVWSEKCLPPGTVHIRLPRVFNTAKRLEIDYAPAMVGFEFRNGRSYPVFDGIVICSEFKDAILEAYSEEVQRRETEEKRQTERRAISRWYQLISSILTRQRLNSHYGDNPSQTATDFQEKKSLECQQDIRNTSIDATSAITLEDHKHVFLLEDQTFDEERSVVTKRCRCGFSVQVEEF